jgi:acyl-coenzyme A synthetase/AMP-(fatty) acid ligase
VFLGRVDHQAKVRGHRVDLHEVETVVRAASGRESVAALPWPVDDETALTRQIVVFVAGHPAAPDEIVAMCRRKLPPPVVPRRIFFIPDWPLNANGKTDYSALKQRLRDQQC